MSVPEVKGWCPGAYRPMMSGDGLIVRVRPRLGRFSARQVLGLCDAAQRFGSGLIDLTSRANLQIRGVAEARHDALMRALSAQDLLDADPALESRRNVIATPFWHEGDLTHRLGCALEARLSELPDIPGKMGVVLDCGAARVLPDASGDFRFERSRDGALILRAEGAATGRDVTEAQAIDRLIELAEWFVATGGRDAGRMGRHLARVALPDEWQGVPPAPVGDRPVPGAAAGGGVLGVPFGQIEAADLAALMTASAATHLRVAPGRLLLLEGGSFVPVPGFVTQPGDPVLAADACPGAPLCSQASVATRALARSLAPLLEGTLHVSGCAKGCARRSAASVTIVGRDGRFDLVPEGHAWDAPAETGLSAHDLCQRFGIADAL